MKKIYYNFSRRNTVCSASFRSILDTVKYVISPYVRLDAEISECKIIEHFDGENLYVGYPPHALGNVKFLTYYRNEYQDSWTGTIHLGIDGTYPRYFRIKDNVLYICKSTYVDVEA
jgi:hypothetical protein